MPLNSNVTISTGYINGARILGVVQQHRKHKNSGLLQRF
jgi:hypothetical protein